MSFWKREQKFRTCAGCNQERRDPQDFTDGTKSVAAEIAEMREIISRDNPSRREWEQRIRNDPKHAHCNDCQQLGHCLICQQRFTPDPNSTDPNRNKRCPACKEKYSIILDPQSEEGWRRDRAAFLDRVPTLLAELGPSPTTTSDGTGAVEIGTARDGSPVRITPSDRNRHVYMIGKTGSGKSSLLRNIIIQDLAAGRGVIYLDPHGDTAQTLLGYVPPERVADVVYFCPVDEACPAFNLLAAPYPADKLTRDVVSAFRMFFGFDQNSAPRLSQLLTNTVLLLLLDREHEPHSLAHVRRVLIDPSYRDVLVARCPHESVKQFWTLEFPRFPKDATLPVLNKFSDLLMPLSPMERIFSSTQNALDLNEIMNGGKILLVNLSKGELGEAGAFLIGALIVTAVNQAALARARIPEHERRDVFLFVDEFQNFVVDSFESILSEARKYRLNLTVAHQYLAQVPSNLRSAIFGNVAVSMALPISAEDATTMQREFASQTYVHRQTGDRYDPKAELRQHCETIINGTSTYPINPRAKAITDAANFSIGWVTAFLKRNREPDPETYAPGQWPSSEAFKLLSPLSGFVKINNASNVHRFTIHHPTEKPRDDIRRAILERQHLEHEGRQRPTSSPTSPAPATSAERPHQKPQDARTATETTQTIDQESTKSPDAPGDDFDEFLT